MKTPIKLTFVLYTIVLTGLLLASGYFVYRSFYTNVSLCKKCNVVIIDLDVLRADDLPCYGYRRNTAPNLCKFASRATLFKQNYSQANWTLPSIFSTITSLYPWAHGVKSEFVNLLSPAVTTLAEQFRAGGYYTAFVGPKEQFYLINNANGGTRGFDSFQDPPGDMRNVLNNLYASHKPFLLHYYVEAAHIPYLLEREGDQMEALPKPPGLSITQKDYDSVLGNYLKANYNNIFTQKAIAERPDLFTDSALGANERLANFFNTKLASVTQHDYIIRAWRPQLNSYVQFINVKNPSHMAYLRMLYDSKIKEADNKLGALLTLLSSPRLERNTIVVVMSDHGEAFGEHGTISHENDPYTELYYTPLVVRVPGQKPRVTDSVSQNIDIFPTLLSLVGIPPVAQAQGTSLVSIIRGETPKEDRYAVSESEVGEIIQNKEWMLLWHQATSSARAVELYHKLSDPTEQTNLAGLPQYANQKQKLFSLLQKIRNDTSAPLAVPSVVPPWMDQKTLERLKREGYF